MYMIKHGDYINVITASFLKYMLILCHERYFPSFLLSKYHRPEFAIERTHFILSGPSVGTKRLCSDTYRLYLSFVSTFLSVFLGLVPSAVLVVTKK